MLPLLVPFALAAECPAAPALRDPDGEVTALAQNLKFIVTGEKRKERTGLLRDWLDHEGAHVDLLLLSEARITRGMEDWAPEWCFYTQLPADRDGYAWAPITSGRPPGGLALGVRQRDEGVERSVGLLAGRKYRARPTSLAEGFLGKLFNFEKGWAGVRIDDTHLVWSHTQASYRKDPSVGAGEAGRGRAGQFEDLAEDLGRPEHATLLTGDLNLLAGFRPKRADDEPRVEAARAKDDATVARFREQTGIDLTWRWERARVAHLDVDPAVSSVETGESAATTAGAGAGAVAAPAGTFAGRIDRRRAERAWDEGAPYDRVGVNDAFLERHPGTRVRPVEIVRDWLGVSDHFGLEIVIPFRDRLTAEREHGAEAPE